MKITDKQRLDYIESSRQSLYCLQRWRRKKTAHGPHDQRMPVDVWMIGGNSEEFDTPREAIDAAINRENEK